MAETLKILSKKFLWLDRNVNSKENRIIQEKFRSSKYQIEIFEDNFACEKYIQTCSSDNHRLILIINGKFSKNLIPKIHDYRQIHSIYIYSLNEEYFRPWWLNKYPKIIEIINNYDKLISRIAHRRNILDESFSISIHDANLKVGQTTSALDGQFVHHQLLTDCLLRMEPTPTEKNEFISYYKKEYHTPPSDLKIIKEFEQTYSPENSIYWYTKDTFLFRKLNESLRTQNIDLLFRLRFFIRDLYKQLQINCCQKEKILYRGQKMSIDELAILQQSEGKLISTNSFLSTSIYPETVHMFCVSKEDEKCKGVIFEINAGPYRSGMKPFANIELLSEYPQENEVLMMLGSVFRLNKIYQNEEQIWIIQMTLCSDSDHDLESVFNHLRKQYEYGQTRLLLFGHVLVDMAYFNIAEKYYRRLLNEMSTNHQDLSKCYHALGKVACEKSEYDESLYYLNRSLEIIEKKFRKNHPRLGFIYLSIGEVYQKKGEYQLAVQAYEEARKIWMNKFHPEHEYIAWCWNNIGIIYDADKKYFDALESHKKALKIKQLHLPLKHPCMGNSYLNLGNVYYHLKDYKQALENYESAYEIYETSLPHEHPSLASAGRNIGMIYEITEKYEQALKYYRKSADIRRRIYQRKHPDNAEIEQDIQRILLKTKSNS